MSNNPHICDFCGERAAIKTWQVESFLYGSGEDRVELAASVPVWKCDACGTSFTGEEAEELRHEAVCAHLGRLTPNDIRAIRQSFGLSQDQFSELSGFGIASIKRWESANQIQNLSADRYLRLLSMPENFRAISALAGSRTSLKTTFRTNLPESSIQDAKLFRLRPRALAEAA